MAGSHINSHEVFKTKLYDFGLDSFYSRMYNAGYKDMQRFAVSCGYNPETVKDDEFVETVVKKMTLWNGTAPEPASINNFRGLFWDCIQALLADTRAKYDPRTEDLPCKLGKHDRRHRRKQIQERMKGAVPDIMQRELEPSHAAEDDLFAMFKDDCLGPYMGPEDFPTRTQ